MAVPRSLSKFVSTRFNQSGGYWYFTKAKTLKPESIDEIVDYHTKLQTLVVGANQVWDGSTQATFSEAVAGRPVSTAWGRELKIFFGLLGTAWVERSNHVVFTEIGKALLKSAQPTLILENQVRKYQISNPSILNKSKGIRLLPHHALLKVLLNLDSQSISRDEFVVFVSHMYDSDKDLEYVCSLIRSYRMLTASDKSRVLSSLNADKKRQVSWFWSYAANFLSFPHCLAYSDASIHIADTLAAERILRWYEAGNAQHIEFDTAKDWFSYYGSISSEPTPLEAIHYYRRMRTPERARIAFRQALRNGHISPRETEMEFFCRIQGEARLEDWLEYNLDRLEPGLTFLNRQYETIDAGRLDILAKDVHGDYVVVELKRDMANDKALGQLLRYMGWVRMNLAVDNEVRGYVIGEEIDEGMVYATLANDIIDRICKTRTYSQLKVRLDMRRTANDCSAEVIDLLTGSTP